METTQKVIAFLNVGIEKLEIGEMIQNQNKIYFKYDLDFIAKGIEISPFKMKLSDAILTCLSSQRLVFLRFLSLLRQFAFARVQRRRNLHK